MWHRVDSPSVSVNPGQRQESITEAAESKTASFLENLTRPPSLVMTAGKEGQADCRFFDLSLPKCVIPHSGSESVLRVVGAQPCKACVAHSTFSLLRPRQILPQCHHFRVNTFVLPSTACDFVRRLAFLSEAVARLF